MKLFQLGNRVFVSSTLCLAMTVSSRGGEGAEQDIVPVPGESFVITCPPYKMEINTVDKFCMRSVSYEGWKCLPRGSNAMVLVYAPGKFVGGAHREGGEEIVEKAEFLLDGKTMIPETGKTYAAKNFIRKKTAVLDKLKVESVVELSTEGIVERRQFVALEEQPTSLIYLFMYCWTTSTKHWLGCLTNGEKISGDFIDDNKFKLENDVKWAAEYDPAANKGILIFHPAVIPGKGHKSTFWDVAGIYHKYYLQIDTPALIPKGYKSPLAMIVIKGFSAAQGNWRSQAEMSAEELAIKQRGGK